MSYGNKVDAAKNICFVIHDWIAARFSNCFQSSYVNDTIDLILKFKIKIATLKIFYLTQFYKIFSNFQIEKNMATLPGTTCVYFK